MKDRSRREENKEECSEGSPLGKLSGAYSQNYRGQFFLKSISQPLFPNCHQFSMPHCHLIFVLTSSLQSPGIQCHQLRHHHLHHRLGLSGSLLGSDSGPVHSGLFLGLFLNHFGFSLIFRVSPLRLFEFQSFSPSVLCSPSIVLLLFFYTYYVHSFLFVCDCDLNFMPKFTYLTF